MLSKVCRKCTTSKEITEFHKQTNSKDGLNIYCKICVNSFYNKEYGIKYRAKNLELIKTRHKQWTKNNKPKIREYNLKKEYDLSIEDYKLMMLKQNNSCAICTLPQKDFKRNLAVDHCHKSNIIRGLLCRKCNLLLGNADDKVNILKNAIKYLEGFND